MFRSKTFVLLNDDLSEATNIVYQELRPTIKDVSIVRGTITIDILLVGSKVTTRLVDSMVYEGLYHTAPTVVESIDESVNTNRPSVH